MSLIILDVPNPDNVIQVLDAVLEFGNIEYGWVKTNTVELAKQNESLRKMLECVQNNLAYGSMGKVMQKTQAKAIRQVLEDL